MDPTWRKDPFIRGAHYRVRKSFDSALGLFQAGDVLRYEESGYSRYDSSSVFHFRHATGKIEAWEVHDDEPLDLWSEFFELA